MIPTTPPQVSIPPGHFTTGQGAHLLLLAALLPTPMLLAAPFMGDGSFLGLSDRTWLIAAVAIPVVHQLIVVLLWRAQLSHQLLTRLFGKHDLTVWGLIFLPLLAARPLAVLGLGLADTGSLSLPQPLLWGLAVLCLAPAAYAGWSVLRYFGIPRALGGDHFREHYRVMPFIAAGAFRWTNNAMYTLAFLGLWGIALACGSAAALAAVLFQHAYIWVHWYCTEEPDIRVLYSPSGAE